MSVVKFLNARLGELEALAKMATPGPWTNLSRHGSGGVDVWTVADSQRAGYEGMRDRVAGCAITTGKFQTEVLNAAFIAANDPAFVVADIAAKRRIIEWAALWTESEPDSDDRGPAQLRAALPGILARLAEPFADHPDFDPAWSA